jgi:hypothetical protein
VRQNSYPLRLLALLAGGIFIDLAAVTGREMSVDAA